VYTQTNSGGQWGCTTLGIPYSSASNFPPATNTPVLGINGYNPSSNQYTSSTTTAYQGGIANALGARSPSIIAGYTAGSTGAIAIR